MEEPVSMGVVLAPLDLHIAKSVVLHTHVLMPQAVINTVVVKNPVLELIAPFKAKYVPLASVPQPVQAVQRFARIIASINLQHM